MTISEKQIEELGKMADTADNLIAASRMPIPDATHKQCLVSGFESFSEKLKTIVREVSGNDPWAI